MSNIITKKITKRHGMRQAESAGKTVRNKEKSSGRFMTLAAFLIPMLVMLIGMITIGVYPFGDHTAMIIDSYHQYVPFLSELRYKLWHGGSLFYSWHGSLGFNFLTVWAYYLASPLNILLVLFPENMITECFDLLILIKIGLSGLTAYLYLKHMTGKKDVMMVLFSSFYALGGFTLAYNWNIMWLDSIYLFPLILIGANKLIDESNGTLYTVTLAMAIFTNYYMAIMICIFLVLYFFVHWFSLGRTGIKAFIVAGVRYALCSLLAGGMAAAVLVPTYYTLMHSSAGSSPSNWKIYRSFAEVLAQHLTMMEPTQLTGAPNIYCGLLICTLVPVYLVCKRIPVKKRILTGLLALFMLVSLNVNVLDYIWHGFHFPNNLPGRFSFIYILILVTMAAEAWKQLPGISMKRLIAALFVQAAGLATVVVLTRDTLSREAMITGIIASLAYIFALLSYVYFSHRPLDTLGRKKSLPVYRVVGGVLIGLLVGELLANTIYACQCNGSTTRSSYMSDKLEMADIRDRYASGEDAFYRMELGTMRGRDEVTYQNMNGLSYFSSTCSDDLEFLMGALGFYNSGNKFSYKGATPVTDAMLGIRYVINNKEMTDDNLVLVEKTEHKYVYENRQVLSLGYMVNDNMESWQILDGDPFIILNDMARIATDTEDAIFSFRNVPEPETHGVSISSSSGEVWSFTKEEGSDQSITFRLQLDEVEDYYLYFEASRCDSMSVEIDGVSRNYVDERGHIVHLGELGPENEVVLRFPIKSSSSSGNVKLQLAAYDAEAFARVYEILSSQQLVISEAGDTLIKGRIDAGEGGLMMLSIPYDEGWTVMVDGQETEKLVIGRALTGVRLEAGEHDIQLRYRPQGWGVGIALTMLSLLIFALWTIYKIFIKKPR